MSNVRETSKEAYEYCQEHGITQGQQKEIVRAMIEKGKPMTRHEIAHRTGIETSSVSARVNKMLKEKALEETAKITCQITGRQAYGVKLINCVDSMNNVHI